MKYRIKPLVIFLCVLFLISACQKEEAPTQAAPPPQVDVYTTKAEDVPIFQTYVGQVYGAKDIAIRARVEGFLNGIHFKEGSEVKAGALLYTIDSQPFEAQVAAQKGLVAEANTHLTKAKVGDFVGRDPNPVILNTVSNTDHILVEFFLSETQYLKLARQYLAETEEERQRDREGSRDIQLILADDTLYPYKGKATFIDRMIDPMTGAILVQASFPNPSGMMRPGQFAKVKIQISNARDSILVPQRAVTELQGMTRVFVVDDKDRVQERKVTMGPKVDNLWLVSEGLKPGEKIIFEGLQKVADGVVVKPVEKQFQRIKQDGQ